MDIVVVTCAADAHLLRFFLASYATFWDGQGRLILVSRRKDEFLWEQIYLPEQTRLIYREDFPELGDDDFRNQLYLKLISHSFVKSELRRSGLSRYHSPAKTRRPLKKP